VKGSGSRIAKSFLITSRGHLLGEYVPKLKRCLRVLSEDDVWWRPNAASNSVGNLVLHLCGNARQWIVSGVCGGSDTRDRPGEFERRSGLGGDDLIGHLESTMAEVDAALRSLEAVADGRPDLLEERRTIQGMDVTVLDAVYHVVEHFSQHTGQVIYITKQRTGRDLAFWEVEGAVARPNW
jgi:uncharacterized damage-inducible protein DinB